MKNKLGTRQEQIILFLDSQPYKRSTRREIREYFKKLEDIPGSKMNKVDNCIDRLLKSGDIIHPRIRDLTRSDVLFKHPSQRPKMVELNYTTRVKEFLTKNDILPK